MGGVPSVLLFLWCRSGCSTATVAAALTFFPPNPPCYTLRKKEGSGELELVVDEMLEATVPTDGVEIATVRSGAPRGSKRARDEPPYPPPSTAKLAKDKGHHDQVSKLSPGKGGIGSVIPLALYRKPGARFTLVYSHGNATDIGAMHDRCAGIAEAVGVNVLAYDYTGYGAASGTPTEEQTYRDIEAVCDWAREHILREGEDGSGKNKEQGLILYGQSVGSGPTSYIAGEKEMGVFAGVVLHSPILSGMRVLTDSRALSCLDIYPNVDRVSRIRCPVMVMHGMKDEEVPWEHGKGIHDAVPENLRRRPWWVSDRGHNDICEGRRHLREYFARLGEFVRSLDSDDGQAVAPTHPAASSAAAASADRRANAGLVSASSSSSLKPNANVNVNSTRVVRATASPSVRNGGTDRRVAAAGPKGSTNKAVVGVGSGGGDGCAGGAKGGQGLVGVGAAVAEGAAGGPGSTLTATTISTVASGEYLGDDGRSGAREDRSR